MAPTKLQSESTWQHKYNKVLTSHHKVSPEKIKQNSNQKGKTRVVFAEREGAMVFRPSKMFAF